MDKGQKEFTEKIRSAIKKKLVEINAFVDDELPDYIMILVANKRSKPQIEKDLVLFLGDDTVVFTEWLWDLVKNMKVNSKVKASTTVPKRKECLQQNDPQSDEDADVLDYDMDEQESDILDQEDDFRNLLQASTNSETNNQTSNVSESLPVVKTEFSLNEKIEKEVTDLGQIRQRSAKVYPIRQIQRVPVSSVVPVQLRISNLEDEYDPTKPECSGNVSSVVRVSQRNYGGPAALQANKLLLKAVNEATKSVLHGRSINDIYKPTPIKVLSPDRKEKSSTGFCNLINVKTNSHLKVNRKSKEPKSINSPVIEYESKLDASESENYVLQNTSNINRTICLSSDSTEFSVFDNTSNFPFRTNCTQPLNQQEERVSSPHFIVTLDGIDLPSLKRKFSEDSEGSLKMDEDDVPFVDNDNVTGSVPEKKRKITERCKYWPACKNNNDCVYHHPAVPCKCFPECKYGDRCLYIHPNCKFDALCSRKDCPYIHASKRKFPLPQVPVKVKKRSSKIVCKFYPKCTVNNCPFVHPRLCRYGTKCRLPVCPYSHFSVPSRNQMRWKANG